MGARPLLITAHLLSTFLYTNAQASNPRALLKPHAGTYEKPCIMIGTKCLITDVNITIENFSTLVPKTPQNFTGTPNEFEIMSSTLEILTGDICLAMKLLKNFKAEGVGMKEVKDESFAACKNLTNVDLSHNEIETLPFQLFNTNKLLLSVDLSNNQLKEIEPKLLYPIWALNRVELQNNRLQSLDPVVFKGSRSIEIIKVYSNELDDLKETELAKMIPNLRIIYVADNDFLCDRVKGMVAGFNKMNVSVVMFYDEPRKRDVAVAVEDGTPCLRNRTTTLFPRSGNDSSIRVFHDQMALHVQPNPSFEDVELLKNNSAKIMKTLESVNTKIDRLTSDVSRISYRAPAQTGARAATG